MKPHHQLYQNFISYPTSPGTVVAVDSSLGDPCTCRKQFCQFCVPWIPCGFHGWFGQSMLHSACSPCAPCRWGTLPPLPLPGGQRYPTGAGPLGFKLRSLRVVLALTKMLLGVATPSSVFCGGRHCQSAASSNVAHSAQSLSDLVTYTHNSLHIHRYQLWSRGRNPTIKYFTSKRIGSMSSIPPLENRM